MDNTSTSNLMFKRLIPPLALFLATKLLDSQKAKGALQEADSYAYIGKRRAGRAIRRLGRNASNNRAWLAAGAAAFALGIGLMARAGRKPAR